MKSICFYFQVHQPFRLRTYRFFDIGRNSFYYDDYFNRMIMRRIAEKSYLPMNEILMQQIKEYGNRFKVTFSISGLAIEQMEFYSPEVLESFKKLVATGQVEILAETYAHSLSSLKDPQEFEREPNAEEIAEILEVTENEVKESMKNAGRHVSMDAPLIQDEDNTMYDVLRSEEAITPETELLYESLRKEIDRAISTLTPREADVVRLYFGLNGSYPMTLEEIGEKFDLTRERVRQIKEKAIRRLKHTSRSKILKSYLG